MKKKFIATNGISIKTAMRHMNEIGERVLFIVDKNKRLLASLSDGDVRRWSATV